MKRYGILAAKLAALALVTLLVAGVIAPYLRADQFGQKIKAALEGALGRRVDIGRVRFNVFKGPGFEVYNVVIHEDPSIGIEPIARMETLEVVPRFWPLLGGHFVAAAIRLDDASINLSKTGGPSDVGRWNFDRLLHRSAISAFPAIRIRNGRINFKFGDTKSTYYLLNTDLDIEPPSVATGKWNIDMQAETARTDRKALGLGLFTARGYWLPANTGTDRLELDVRMDRTPLADITALLRGQAGGVHGTLSSRLHVSGPLADIQIAGRVNIEDVHRWDLLPLKGDGWPLDVRGHLNLTDQTLDLESNSAGNAPLPITVRFRVSDYLSQPRWGLSVNWNQFPVEPLMELGRHMGVQYPPNLKLTGTVDGALVYSGENTLQGEMVLHNTVVTVPGSPPVHFEQAAVVFAQGHTVLKPAAVRISGEDQATIEADYALNSETLDLRIASEGMQVASLRSQVALAAIPWLEQVRAGKWSGELSYHYAPAGECGWTGNLHVTGAELALDGAAEPLLLHSARASITGPRIVLDRIEATLGKTAFSGEYRYEPKLSRPHRIRLAATAIDLAAIEDTFRPTLERSGNLLARALGRTPLPEWLAKRNVEGTLTAGTLTVAGQQFEKFKARLIWDAARLEVNNLQATIDEGELSGKATINLRGARPIYSFAGQLAGMEWQGGHLDSEATIEATGIGSQLLTTLESHGTFTGADLDLGSRPPWKSVAGTFQFGIAKGQPHLRFTDLQLTTGEETYTGRGASQDDGRILLVLTSGTRQMRISGTLAQLKVEEPAAR